MNLRSFDLNLLLVFDAVYADRSITVAAKKLGMTQPAVSNALSRLRKQLGDSLFKRAGQGMEPTPEANRVAPEIREALRVIKAAISLGEKFDPATSKRRFSMVMPDAIELAIMGPLLEKIRQDTPEITYALEPLEVASFEQTLLSKTVDLGFFLNPVYEGRLRTSMLFSEPSCVIVRADHPVYGDRETFSVDDLFEAQFVTIMPDLRKLTQIDQQSRVLGRSRNVVFETKRLWSVPYVVASSHLAGFLPRNLADSVASMLNLKVFDVPIEIPPESWHMVWHEDFDSDAGHGWLRNTIMALFANGFAGKSTGAGIYAGSSK